MPIALRTLVTFESSAFNDSEPRDYFINECCFGDDVLRWLGERLRERGHSADREPTQEDFGWVLGYAVDGVRHQLIFGHRPGDGSDAPDERRGDPAIWLGWVRRKRNPLAAIFGAEKMGIKPAAVRAIHDALSAPELIRNIRWHVERDFNALRENLATPEP